MTQCASSAEVEKFDMAREKDENKRLNYLRNDLSPEKYHCHPAFLRGSFCAARNTCS